MAHSHWRFFLLRWHRRLGVVSALFVLLLAVTGLMLNHSHELGLDRAPLENATLRHFYGIAPAPAAVAAGLVQPLPAGELRAEGGQLRLAGRTLGPCPQLVGVVEQPQQVLVVCSNRLWLLAPSGEVIDQADSVRGVPEGLSAVAQGQGQVLLRRGGESLSVDLGDLSVRPAAPVPGMAWSDAPPEAGAAELDWEEVVLDLHSGRLFGKWGVLLMDGMAVLFLVLAASGLVMALRRRHRRA